MEEAKKEEKEKKTKKVKEPKAYKHKLKKHRDSVLQI